MMKHEPIGGNVATMGYMASSRLKRPHVLPWHFIDAVDQAIKRQKVLNDVEGNDGTFKTKPGTSIFNETSCNDGMDHEPVDNHDKGDVSCRACGLVLDEKTTVSDVEWAKNKTGVELPAQLERHGDLSHFAILMGNQCPETTLDFSNCKSDVAQSYQFKRDNDAVLQTLYKGYTSIRDLCDQLYITDGKTKDDAFIMLKHCHEKKMFNNETNMTRFLSVCVYMACLDSTPLFQWEVIGKSEVDEKRFKETLRQVQKELSNGTSQADLKIDYVKSLERIVSKLNLNENCAFLIENEARHIMQRIRILVRQVFTCMNDDMLIPAAIYASTCVHANLKHDELKSLKIKLSKMFNIGLRSLDSAFEKDILANVDSFISKRELADKLRQTSASNRVDR